MYSLKEIEKMLVWDIETISKYESLDEMPNKLKEIWLYRYHQKFQEMGFKETEKLQLSGKPILFDYNDANDIYLKFAPLVAEFNKVIAVSFSKFDTKDKVIDTEVIANINEKKVLEFSADVFNNLKGDVLTGFNIKSFDIPVMHKSYVINDMPVPDALNFKGKKPWEMQVTDVMEDWKLGSWEGCSFELYCEILGLGSTKDGNANGENLGLLWYNDKIVIEDVETYVKADTETLLKGILKTSNISYNE